MTAKFVSVEKGLGPEGRIGIVRLDRSDAINALSPEVMRQLRAAAQAFEDDAATSVVILTGNARVFSAGFDLKDEEGHARAKLGLGEQRAALRIGPRMCRAWWDMEQVTIAAIERPCIGGGVALAASLDFRFCGKSALPHPRGGARHEHELGLAATIACTDGAGAHQAGRHPRRRPDQRW
jgi:enoyl-CoA hydratase